MKKLVLFLAVAFSATMFSCGNAEKADNACDSACCDSAVEVAAAVVEVADSAAADSAAVDTVVAEVAEVVAE
ncbi:MAG: hypothetical protein HDS30_02415 [Bacteroides sp.]|nr:hypothetical protein [Bacteroides sp.]MDE6043632.1 hypothetical protein [Muribaculaceae bacterium]